MIGGNVGTTQTSILKVSLGLERACIKGKTQGSWESGGKMKGNGIK